MKIIYCLMGLHIAEAETLNRMDVQSGSNVCLLGYDVAKKMFKQGIERATNAMVRINNIPYRVLGVLESRGSTLWI